MSPSEPLWNRNISNPSSFLVESSDTYRDPSEVKMSSTDEVKRESEGKLSEGSANEKYLYSRVLELEKRNQKLEKKVKRLKKKKKELKEEVAKLRGAVPVQYGTDDHDASTSDVEVVEELNIGSRQPNPYEEQAVHSNVNSNNVDEEAAFQSNGAAQVDENRELAIEGAAEMEAGNSEKAVDNPSGTGSSEVPNQCPQCGKGFSKPWGLSRHISEVHHGVKVNCPSCFKHFTPSSLKTHIRGVHRRERKKCPHCPKNFHPKSLPQHIRKAHKDA